MADLPRHLKQTKVGSNVKGHKALHAPDERRIERRLKPFRSAERQFLRDGRAILTKPAVKQAVAILQQQNDAYAKAFLKANGDGVAIGNARRRARRSIDRAFRPPFALFDVGPPRSNGSVVPPSSSGSADNSFAQPGTGIVVTNVQFHNDGRPRLF